MTHAPSTVADRRKILPVLVYICGSCLKAGEWSYGMLSDGPGCPMEHDDDNHLMRKRRVWICPTCDPEHHAYLSRKDFLEHEHDA